MFRNRHFTVALLIAPVLAIIAWFSVDYFVAERPHVAKPGASYALVAKPNCRRASDRCELVNEDVALAVSVPSCEAGGLDVELTSSIAVDRAAIGLVDGAPTALSPAAGHVDRWRGNIVGSVTPDSSLRIAIVVGESTFYAEIPVTFFVSNCLSGQDRA